MSRRGVTVIQLLFISLSFFQVKNLTLRIEQETQKRSLTQNDLKAQNQQLNSLRTSEKQLKQEMNHLLDIKRSLEKQNQELRKSVCSLFSLLLCTPFCQNEDDE